MSVLKQMSLDPWKTDVWLIEMVTTLVFGHPVGGGSLGGNVPFSWEPPRRQHSLRVKQPHPLAALEATFKYSLHQAQSLHDL